jgi:hypothetical protein
MNLTSTHSKIINQVSILNFVQWVSMNHKSKPQILSSSSFLIWFFCQVFFLLYSSFPRSIYQQLWQRSQICSKLLLSWSYCCGETSWFSPHPHSFNLTCLKLRGNLLWLFRVNKYPKTLILIQYLWDDSPSSYYVFITKHFCPRDWSFWTWQHSSQVTIYLSSSRTPSIQV